MRKYWLILLLFVSTAVLAQTNSAYYLQGVKSYSYLTSGLISSKAKLHPVKVAIIDDAFNINHRSLAPYIFRNRKEIRNNLKDDDGNGYLDDFVGWDVADGDPKVGLPNETSVPHEFYHGTMVAGVIAKTVEQTLGTDLAKKYFQLIPIKALSDKTTKGNYEQAYKGMQYALAMGADIICLAWSGGQFDSVYLPLFEEARRKNVLILASAGNFYSEVISYPSGLPGVYTIAAADTTLEKLPSSNYHAQVSLSAVATNVLAPYAASDSLFTFLEKTSAAVAIATGCAATLKALKPTLTPFELMTALQNTATRMRESSYEYYGKLGAGVPHMKNAVEHVSNPKATTGQYFDSKRPKGAFVVSKKEHRRKWQVDLPSVNSEIRLSLIGDAQKNTKTFLQIRNLSGETVLRQALSEMEEEVRLQGQQFMIEVEGKLPKNPIYIPYTMSTPDSSKLYCTGIVTLLAASGLIEDGSQEHPYAGNSACKWLIEVEKGKNIRLDFLEFDTQEAKDNLLVFKGTQTLQENLMARFSGQRLPPSLVIYGNQVLLWFLSDQKGHAQGFKIRYHATDEAPGVL